jgi:4-hydroxy 2-oxovalerate aldolase
VGIEFLDCTLRDGAHVNAGAFGEDHIVNIINGLTNASVDIVEIGFLKQGVYSSDITYFPRIEDAYRMLSRIPVKQGVEYALMARSDEYNISRLSECTEKIKLIRIAFYYDYLKPTISFAKEVKKRGYNFTLNLINTPGNTLDELSEVVKYANEINPYALMIVDTFGVLCMEDLEAIATNYDAKLNSNIRLGLHLHENRSLAFSLAQRFIKRETGRDIIVDGSLMGIGRAPGNLCTELIADYLNNYYGKNINLPDVLRLIEKDIVPIRQMYQWGYSPSYFLSAKYKVHRSYAEYLSDEQVELDQMNILLSQIECEYAKKFNKAYINTLIKKMKKLSEKENGK